MAIARYVWTDDRPRTAEVAAEVANDLQGLGIGTALARLTVQRAHDNGFELVRATTLATTAAPVRCRARQVPGRTVVRSSR